MPHYDDLSEFDLLQLIDLDAKARNEGSLAYACENWSWTFESADLANAFAVAVFGDVHDMRAALDATYVRREAWWVAHPHPTQIAPLEAHEAEVERREAVTNGDAR